MTKLEMSKIMFYLAADRDTIISDEKLLVWFDQFQHLEYATGVAAAKLFLSKDGHRFPQVNDFHVAVAEVLAGGNKLYSWGEAWDIWVKIARRFGYTRCGDAMKVFSRECPVGAKAMGTLAPEWFTSSDDDVKILRAQFRQRFETAVREDAHKRTLNPAIAKFIDEQRAEEQVKQLPAPERVGSIVNDVLQKYGVTK